MIPKDAPAWLEKVVMTVFVSAVVSIIGLLLFAFFRLSQIEGVQIDFNRSAAVFFGAWLADYEWKFEPTGADSLYGLRIEHIFAYQPVVSAYNVSGWKFAPESGVANVDWQVIRSSDERNKTGKVNIAKRIFGYAHYGGGTTCYRRYHPDSNGYRGRPIGEDVRLLSLCTCIPDYFKLIGHPPDSSVVPRNFNDTLFVLHVWRKGLKWPDVRKLAVPNEAQEQVNRERNERWWKNRTQAEIDSMDQEREQFRRAWRRDRQREQEAERKRREAAGE